MKDVNDYMKRYLDVTGDTVRYNHLNVIYNLTADKSKLILKDKDGMRTDFEKLLGEHKGKVIYVNFWVSWCAPCRSEMPASAGLRKRYAGKDVVFVFLALNDRTDQWKKAAKEEGIYDMPTSFFIENSKNSELLEQLKVNTIPRYLIFDKTGELVEQKAPRPSDKNIDITLDKYLNP